MKMMSTFSRQYRIGDAPRASTAGCVPAGDLRSGNNPGALIRTRYFPRCLPAAFATLGLTALARAFSVHAQVAPALGTVANFVVLGASTVTDTGSSILSGTAANPGNLGVSPGTAITGFPPAF